MQAIAPVIEMLQATGKFEISTYATRESFPVISKLNLQVARLDEKVFNADPVGYTRSIFEAHSPALVLTGSSPARSAAPETPEQFAVLTARNIDVKSVVVLDAWHQYKERFCIDPLANQAAPELIPDIVCVLDRLCQNHLQSLGVPADKLLITHNPWLDQVVHDAANPPAASIELGRDALNVVYVSQPLAEMANIRGWPFTQQDVFDSLVYALPPAPFGARHRIWVWVHPSEDVGRWIGSLTLPRADIEAVVTEERGVAVLAHVDFVVSSHSTVTYEALHYGTPCISLRPGGKNLATLVTDDLGLSRVFHDKETFKEFLSDAQVMQLRKELYHHRAELRASGTFFSGGFATKRVVDAIFGVIAPSTLN